MLITCTNCGTSYQVAAASLGPTGRSVRCARCKQMWFAANAEVRAEAAAPHRADLAAIAEAPSIADPPPPERGFAPAPGMSLEEGPAEQGFGNDPGSARPVWSASDATAQDEHQD